MKGKVYKNDQDRYFFGFSGRREDDPDQEIIERRIGQAEGGPDRE